MREKPRKLDLSATFEAIVQWVEKTARAQNAPGAIIGVSGTDSILAFLASAAAFERMGKADRVLGVHYAVDGEGALPPQGKVAAGFSCISAEFNWVVNDIFPFLAQKAPMARLEVYHGRDFDNDVIRWGHLFARAVRDTGAAQSLGQSHFFPVGARNATEDYLGTYSQISKAVSLQPLNDLYKSEVLALCEYLGVPQIALDKSRTVDCDCGRFDTAAHYLDAVDAFIMSEQGALSKAYIRNWGKETRARVMEFVLEERARNAFRTQTPYKPDIALAVEME